MARRDYEDSYVNSGIYTDTDVSYVGGTEAIDPTMPVMPTGAAAYRGGETETIPEPQPQTEIAGVVEGVQVAQTVGWLICVKGQCKGRDFRLHNGYNTIGRNTDNDVCIADPKVSGKMAKVSYDDRNRGFAISPSEEARNLTYCNNKPVYNTVEINAYDMISMGDSDFIFVPLCGPHFSWEE